MCFVFNEYALSEFGVSSRSIHFNSSVFSLQVVELFFCNFRYSFAAAFFCHLTVFFSPCEQDEEQDSDDIEMKKEKKQKKQKQKEEENDSEDDNEKVKKTKKKKKLKKAESESEDDAVKVSIDVFKLPH